MCAWMLARRQTSSRRRSRAATKSLAEVHSPAQAAIQGLRDRAVVSSAPRRGKPGEVPLRALILPPNTRDRYCTAH